MGQTPPGAVRWWWGKKDRRYRAWLPCDSSSNSLPYLTTRPADGREQPRRRGPTLTADGPSVHGPVTGARAWRRRRASPGSRAPSAPKDVATAALARLLFRLARADV